ENLEWFGVRLNDENNENFINMREGIISTENSRPDIYVIPTNEELLIARDTVRLI
ncbi:MAG: acetate kinase, partial [Acidobacteriota bacterium]